MPGVINYNFVEVYVNIHYSTLMATEAVTVPPYFRRD